MLRELHITGLGVIEDAQLSLGPGLTVLTGETGAGKTLVVTALQLLAGARASGTLVRDGAPAARLDARFAPPPGEAVDWTGDDEELVVSRELPADGRGRVRLHGRLAPVGALEATVGAVVEIHAQHEHVRLAEPARQLEALDRYAGLDDAVARCADGYAAWRRLDERSRDREESARERARELDRLRYELAEIDAAALDPEADARVDERLGLAEHAEEIRDAVAHAAFALSSEGAGEPLGVAVSRLRRLDAGDEELTRLHERVETLVAETAEVASDLRDYAEHLDLDPARLEALRARRALLADLTRKYGDDVDGVLRYAERARRRERELTEVEEAGDRLDADRTAAADRLRRMADDLHRARADAAVRLAAAIDGHLRDLGMPHARVDVEVTAVGEVGPRGRDKVRILVAPNPGLPATPLGAGASGGERSRIALAVAVALSDVHDARVLVFDEVDAGVGGATAVAVGRKLAALARDGRQVLCVTHLAQLAAFAATHFTVEKRVADGRTTTVVRRIDDARRAAELARMMSGSGDRRPAIEHAEALLEDARVAAR